MNFGKLLFSLMGLTLLSKLLGFSRELFLSYFYGASATTDAYLVALTIPGILFAFFSTAISIGFIPTFTRVSDDIEKRNNFINNIFSILLVISTIIVVLTVFFAEQFVYILAPGFDQATKVLAIKFTRLFVFGVYFSCWLCIFIAFLNYHKKFTIVALAGIPFNISILLSIMLSYYYSIYWLVIGAVFGKLLEILLLYPVVKKFEYNFKFRIDFKDIHVRHLMLLSLPLTLSVAVNQINIIVDKSIASTLEVGAISAINYSHYLVQLVVGIFVITVATIFFPELAKFYNSKDYKKIIFATEKSLRLTNVFVVPCFIYFMFKATQVIEFIYERGNFDKASTSLTSSVFVLFSLGILGFSYREILTRVFYAMHNTKIPVVNSIIGLIVNIILAYVFSSKLGVAGLALATSFSGFLTTMLLFYKLKDLEVFLSFKGLFIDLFKALLSAILSILLIIFLRDDSFFLVLNFIVYISVYIILLILLRNEFILLSLGEIKRLYTK